MFARSMTPDATDVYLSEYEQALGTYRFTYHTIWQAGSVFITASAAIAAIAASHDEGIAIFAPLPFLFWWLGIYRPMNRYGELHGDRAAEIEEILSTTVCGLEMTHFRTFNAERKTYTTKERLKNGELVRKTRVSEVVNGIGILAALAQVVLPAIYFFG